MRGKQLRRFGTLADDARVTRTAAALEGNGIRAIRAANAAESKRILRYTWLRRRH